MTSNNGRGAIAESRFAQTGLTCWFRPVGLHSYHVKSARLTRGRSVAIGVHATPSSHDQSGGHAYTRTIHTDARGRVVFERWDIHGAGHAWGREVAPPAHTPIRAGRTPRGRCCASSSITRAPRPVRVDSAAVGNSF
jgi:hypothetical protein